MKQEIISKLENLLQEENISAASAQIKTIQREYEDAFSKEMETAKQAFTDEGGKAREFVYSKSKEDERIVELFDKFRRLKKQQDEKVKAEQEKNYETKMAVIRDIGDLSKLEVNVSGAIKKLHELQAKYKETGNVPPLKHKDVSAEYNKVVDAFYFGLNLYKASQEVDLKKNFEAKTEILEKIKRLASSEHVKDIERGSKLFRNEWEATGPVPQEKWLVMRDEFKAANDILHEKIKAHYAEQKDKLNQNLEAKKQLVEKAKALVAGEPRNEKEWDQKTKALLAIQDEYKQAGHTDKATGDDVWKEFRAVCDSFFDRKKEFYEEAKGRYEEAKQKKQKLIDEAENLKTSTDWQKTSDRIIQLQQQWKRLPNAHPREEHKLFEQFRAAGNHFFDARRAITAEANAALEQNVQHKETIIQNLHGFVATGNAEEDVKALKEFTKQWQESGQSPAAERKRLNDAFYNKLEEFYGTIAGDEKEKQLIKFKLKIERLEQADNAVELLRKENDFIKKHLNEIQQQVNTYENNMGFFKSSSKTKSPMILEMEEKIAVEKKKLDEWKKKQNLIRTSIDRLEKPAEKVG